MVVRDYGQCLVCSAKLLLRVGIGLEETCEHSFDCPVCHAPITIQAKTGKPPTAWIEVVENVKKIEEDAEAGTVINLHPSFAFRLDEYHSPYAFASMQAGVLLSRHVRAPASARMRDVALHFEVPHTSRVWPVVKGILQLALKGDPAGVLERQISTYRELRRKYKQHFDCRTSYKCAASLLDDVFYPGLATLRSPLRAFVKRQREADPVAFQRLTDFYSQELERESVDRYLSVFTDYFNHFDQFRQVLAHARVGDDGVDDLVVGSKAFDQVKLYYGQAYETMTSGYTVLAGLFNLSQGRAFDSFASMTLKKYMSDVDKAKRSSPFGAVPELAAFAAFEDSALRNGSHHASIWRDGELVKFRSGGAGAQREMSFSRYLHICNKITIALAAMFLIELEFFSLIRLA